MLLLKVKAQVYHSLNLYITDSCIEFIALIKKNFSQNGVISYSRKFISKILKMSFLESCWPIVYAEMGNRVQFYNAPDHGEGADQEGRSFIARVQSVVVD